MAATRAKGGFKTQLQRQNGSAYAPVAELVNLDDGPNEEAVIVDATTMESPNNAGEKISVGLIDAGDISFQVHLIDNESTHTAMETDMKAGQARKYRVVPPGFARVLEFTAFVKSMRRSFPLRDKMTLQVAFAVTGSIEWITPGS